MRRRGGGYHVAVHCRQSRDGLGQAGADKVAVGQWPRERRAASVRLHNGHLLLFQWREIGRSVKLTTVVKPEDLQWSVPRSVARNVRGRQPRGHRAGRRVRSLRRRIAPQRLQRSECR